MDKIPETIPESHFRRPDRLRMLNPTSFMSISMNYSGDRADNILEESTWK